MENTWVALKSTSRDKVLEPDFLRDISEVAVHLGGEDGANATGTQREMSVFTMQVM